MTRENISFAVRYNCSSYWCSFKHIVSFLSRIE